jgi:Zn-dependent peptidase ImmA (M78 family)
MQDRKVMILTTEWTIKYVKEKDYKEEMENAWGFAYYNKPVILIEKGISKFNERHVLRHEIIHAFRYESGLKSCANVDDEQYVDWIATQFTKIYKVYKELKIL